ncbi:MAG: hypothetical protein K2W95_05875 [Candidatus Obscuribacterales bacterium]|nr:hypothetical protein [Candidatus Obscuribacterales bacterium]
MQNRTTRKRVPFVMSGEKMAVPSPSWGGKESGLQGDREDAFGIHFYHSFDHVHRLVSSASEEGLESHQLR